jgi:hypothetical protein
MFVSSTEIQSKSSIWYDSCEVELEIQYIFVYSYYHL